MNKVIILAVTVLLLGCSSNPSTSDKESALAKDMVGEWTNLKVRVTMNSAFGIADSINVFEADTSNWETVIGMKPIHTFFREDSTYNSDHYGVNDSLLFSAMGTWNIIADTLVMKQTSPNVATYRLKTSITDNTATFNGKVDFDDDGIDDDDYYGVQQKSKPAQ